MEVEMKKATIRIQKDADAALAKMGERFVRAWTTGKSAGDTLAFESPAALFHVLTPKRWELIVCLQKLGSSSIRGLARELERDVKRVHEDVGVLIDCGLVARTEDGKINVRYDVIRAEFNLKAVA
jgi:predicted transcriptional regulator